jgi:hypothetical protein
MTRNGISPHPPLLDGEKEGVEKIVLFEGNHGK